MAEEKYKGFIPYVGFALLLSWHFCFWFSPSAIPYMDLLAPSVTAAWLVYLLSSSLSLLVFAGVLGNAHNLSDYRAVLFAAPLGLGLLSLLFSSGLLAGFDALQIGVIPLCLGISESACFLLWGECYGRVKNQETPARAAALVSGVLFVLLLVVAVFPGVVSPVLVAALPLAFGAMLVRDELGEEERSYPVLKPAAVRKRAARNVVVISVISCLVSTACFFLLAIIPVSRLIGGSWTYYNGVLVGAAVVFVASSVVGFRGKEDNPFRILPWLVVLVISAFAMFLGVGPAGDGFAFMFTASVYSAFELVLVLYFALVVQRGCIASAIAFGASLGLFRAGVLAGDSLALFLEAQGLENADVVGWIAALSVSLIAALLMPLFSEGAYMDKLLEGAPESMDEKMIQACHNTGKEFGLSQREQEVLVLLLRGYGIGNIATEFVISPHTVRAHVRHIYTKMDIHGKGELFEYVKSQVAEM